MKYLHKICFLTVVIYPDINQQYHVNRIYGDDDLTLRTAFQIITDCEHMRFF